MKTKIETYIGFAIKKGSTVFGVDNIKQYRKKIYLIVYTPDLSHNSLSVLQRICKKKECLLKAIPNYELLGDKNCKALAICDKSLADAITENLM